MYAPPEKVPTARIKPIVAVALMLCITVGLGLVLYVWSSSFLSSGENAPIAQLTVNHNSDGTYTITVVNVSPKVSTGSIEFFLKDTNYNMVMHGKTYEVLGFGPGFGKGICFEDNDQNGRLNSGDAFLIIPGDPGSPLENHINLSGYRFDLRYDITGDIIASKELP